MASVTFDGIPGGDYECFCWNITQEEAIRLFGLYAGPPDVDEETGEVLRADKSNEDLDRSIGDSGLFRLYPCNAFVAAGIPWDAPSKKMRYTITVEEIPETQENVS